MIRLSVSLKQNKLENLLDENEHQGHLPIKIE